MFELYNDLNVVQYVTKQHKHTLPQESSRTEAKIGWKIYSFWEIFRQ